MKVKIEQGFFVIDGGRFEYEIECDRVETEADILKWVFHLSEKNWVTVGILSDFISVCAEKNKINIRGL